VKVYFEAVRYVATELFEPFDHPNPQRINLAHTVLRILPR